MNKVIPMMNSGKKIKQDQIKYWPSKEKLFQWGSGKHFPKEETVGLNEKRTSLVKIYPHFVTLLKSFLPHNLCFSKPKLVWKVHNHSTHKVLTSIYLK